MNGFTKKVDVVVAGSGPGGATVARTMARAGKKVLLLEKGRENKWLGNHFAGLLFTDKAGLSFSEEGLHVVRAITLGGSTVMFCGSATAPPSWLKARYGIDLDRYTEETMSELSLEPLPDEVIGNAGLRIREAACDLGYSFEKLRKFIDPKKCKSRCGGTCMFGCPYGAKWTAREYVHDMIEAGGELMTRASVTDVTMDDGVATGVVAETPKGRLEVESDVVVIAAGGIGTPSILQKSGIHEAGMGMFIDPLVFVTGVSRFPGTALGPPMSVGTYEFMEEKIIISDLIDPWALWLVMAGWRNVRRLRDFFTYRRMLGLMVKVGDDRKGFITLDGRISKPMSEGDRFRLNKGAAISREILIRAGCDPETIIVGPVRGAHPGATARIGEVVDENLETRVRNLFVADASVIPEALDRPTVLTIIGLGRRLADHLMENVFGLQAQSSGVKQECLNDVA